MQWHIGGPIQIHKFVKTLNGFKYDPYNEDKFLTNKQLIKQASKQLDSFVYFKNSDQSKYGSILKILNDQNSLKNDQYPKTTLEATNVLINHRYDNANKNKHHKK